MNRLILGHDFPNWYVLFLNIAALAMVKCCERVVYYQRQERGGKP